MGIRTIKFSCITCVIYAWLDLQIDIDVLHIVLNLIKNPINGLVIS